MSFAYQRIGCSLILCHELSIKPCVASLAELAAPGKASLSIGMPQGMPGAAAQIRMRGSISTAGPMQPHLGGSMQNGPQGLNF